MPDHQIIRAHRWINFQLLLQTYSSTNLLSSSYYFTVWTFQLAPHRTCRNRTCWCFVLKSAQLHSSSTICRTHQSYNNLIMSCFSVSARHGFSEHVFPDVPSFFWITNAIQLSPFSSLSRVSPELDCCSISSRCRLLPYDLLSARVLPDIETT